MVSQAQRRQQTRQRLLAVAQSLFIERGYTATSTDMILAKAQSSKGAMYHHFKSKADMMAAIYADLSDQVIKVAIAGREPGATPLQGLRQAIDTWLDKVSQPDISVILLEQGPAVLGYARAREIEERYSLKTMSTALEEAQKVGEITVTDIQVTTRMLNALIGEAALLYRDHGQKVKASIIATLDAFFEGLRV